MSAELFLSKLEESGVLDRAILEKLRGQLQKMEKKPSAESVARQLVKKGLLPEQQAQDVLAHLLDPPKEISDEELDAIEDLSSTEIEELEPLAPIEEFAETPELAATEEAPEIEEVAEIEELAEIEEIAEIEEVPVDFGDPFQSIDSLDPALSPGIGAGSSDPADSQPAALRKPATLKKTLKKTFKGKRKEGNQWDSKWVLILPTVLVLIALLGGFLYYLLTSKSADERWEVAENAYSTQNYANAIELHTEFAEAYEGSDPRANISVVRIRMAKIRIPFDRKEWEKTLVVLEENLPLLPNEIAIIEDTGEKGNVRTELAGILPQNALGIVELAAKHREEDINRAEELLNRADVNIDMVNNGSYIPSSQRNIPVTAGRIKTMLESAARVKRRVRREGELLATIEDMETKSKDDKGPEALVLYNTLIRKYPELQIDERLKGTVQEISEKQRELIKPIEPEILVDQGSEKADGTSQVLVTRTGDVVEELRGEIAPFLVNGAVYGINVGLGEIVWRVHVGLNTQIEPQLMGTEDRRVLAANQADDSLLCLNPSDGSVIWRAIIGKPFHKPLVIEGSVFVTTLSGEMISLQASDGARVNATLLPQSISTAPQKMVSNSQRTILQIADTTQIYILESGTLECSNVLYLGHKSGSVTVPPIVLRKHIIVAENRSNDKCNLRVFNLGENQRYKEAQKPVTLEGHIVTPLVLYGRRVIAVTDKGPIYVFEIDAANENEPLKKAVDAFELSAEEGWMRRCHASSGSIWVGSKGLTRLKIQTQTQKLSRTPPSNSHDQFIGPIQHFEYANLLVHVRRRVGSALVSVAGVNAESHQEIWRLDFGAKLVGAPFVDPAVNEPVAASSQGDLFKLTEQAITMPYRRASTAEQDLNFEHQVVMQNGTTAFVGNKSQDRLLYYNKDDIARPMNLLKVDSVSGNLTAAPINFNDQVLLPLRTGLVQLIDPNKVNSPMNFLPEIKSNQKIEWLRPAIAGESSFVIADRSGTLHHVQKTEKGLQLASNVKFPGTLTGPVAVIDKQAVVTSQTEKQHELLSFELANLNLPPKSLEIKGSIEFGPVAINASHALLGTDLGELICVDAQLQQVWTFDVGKTFVAGVVTSENQLAVILMDGRVVWLEDGSSVKEQNIGEPVDRTEGLIYNKKLYFGGGDGTIHVVDTP